MNKYPISDLNCNRSKHEPGLSEILIMETPEDFLRIKNFFCQNPDYVLVEFILSKTFLKNFFQKFLIYLLIFFYYKANVPNDPLRNLLNRQIFKCLTNLIKYFNSIFN